MRHDIARQGVSERGAWVRGRFGDGRAEKGGTDANPDERPHRHSGVALGVVMAAMIVLWMIATIHHTVLAGAGTASGYRAPGTPRHGQRPAGVP